MSGASRSPSSLAARPAFEEGFRVGLGNVDTSAGLLALEILGELNEHRVGSVGE
jgi:hypothetical protein